MAMKLFLHSLDVIEAHHHANLLRAAGIPAEVRNTFLSGAVGDIPFGEAAPQVWIDAAQDEGVARQVLRQASERPVQPDWSCPDCGEWIEGQFGQCWRCGGVRPDV